MVEPIPPSVSNFVGIAIARFFFKVAQVGIS